MSNGPEVPEDDLEIITRVASSPRRISVDGVDYQGHSLSELISYYRFKQGNDGSACDGFRSSRLIRQSASPPNALGTHYGRRC